MDALGYVLIVVVVVIIAGVGASVIAGRRRPLAPGDGARSEARPSGSPTSTEYDRMRPPVNDFHVKGEDALVSFDVPLGAGPVDEVLSNLLIREAVDVLYEKKQHGLPLDQVTRVRAFGLRDGAPAEAGSIDLEQPGVLPELDAPDLVPHASVAAYDPLAELGSQDLAASPGLADVSRTEDLRSIGAELSLTSRIDAGLRSQGVDPASMTASDLAVGLLRLGGYTVTPSEGTNTYVASKAGSRTYLRVVDHAAGGYPELDEKTVNSFMIAFAGIAADRGLLVTDKYGPFMIYDKERREPKVKFITRERLQAFVDSFSVA